MAQISFYRLGSEEPDSRLAFACRLAEKARSLGHSTFIQAESEAQARQLDELLWSYRPGGFLPHSLLAGNQEDSEKVAVGLDQQQSQYSDMMINLSASPCPEPERFRRIDEVICQDPDILARGREAYRFYQSRGFQPETHKL